MYFLGVGLIEAMAVTCPKALGNKNLKLLGIQANQIKFFLLIFCMIFVIINYTISKSILTILAGEEKPYVLIAHEYVQ